MDLKIVKVKCPACGAELTTKENVLAGMLAKNAIAPCRVCKKQSPIKDFIRVSDGQPLGSAMSGAGSSQPQPPQPQPSVQTPPPVQPQFVQPQAPQPQPSVQTPPPVQPQQPEYVQPQAPQPQQFVQPQAPQPQPYMQTPPPVQPQQPEFVQPQAPQPQPYMQTPPPVQPQQPEYVQPQAPQPQQYVQPQPTANVKVGLLKVVQAGHRLQLNPGQNIVGRKVQNPPHADIEIDTPTNRMSRQHLIIDVRMEPGKGYVHYASLYKERVNATFIDDTPLNYGDRVVLESGSIIHLPDVDVRFEIPGL